MDIFETPDEDSFVMVPCSLAAQDICEDTT